MSVVKDNRAANGCIRLHATTVPRRRARADGRDYRCSCVYREVDAPQRLVFPIRFVDAEGRPAFIRLALFKATDRRRYEQELLQAREAATSSLASERETSELREQFIAVLGHDLRNPLASISAGARIIGRDAKTEK